ncbi:MAG TPA: phosphoadenosine phosphosulfate reductase family protein [Verrucomicrobiae bacterium]|nr:phosphoadenosine phosphosulfate reductase family protein [Verrucomicrobiae bacterium]
MKDLRIISVSGGKDSTALYLLAQEYFGNSFLPIFADTGNEHPVTVNYVKNLHVMTEGPEVVMVKADFTKQLEKKGIIPTENPFADMMLWKGRAPSTKAQFCTEHVKLWPIRFYLEKHYPRDCYNWIMFTGIRAGESERRSKMQPFNWNSFFNCESVLPLLYESKEQIFSLMAQKGVPPNPLYALGNNRVGCYPCIHANKNQLQVLPEWAWDKIEHWENMLGRSWFPSGILPGKPKGYIPKISEVKEWCKTSRGGKQYNAFKQDAPDDAPSCMTGWLQCE